MDPASSEDPDPEKRWLTFLRNHREAIAAMDFFTVPIAGVRASNYAPAAAPPTIRHRFSGA
jgi:hypothetical protein